MESIKNELLEIKKRKALSIDDMAQFIGIGRNTLGRILRNDNYRASEAVSHKVRKYIFDNKHKEIDISVGLNSDIATENVRTNNAEINEAEDVFFGELELQENEQPYQGTGLSERFETHTVVDNAVHNHLKKQIDELRKNNTVKSSVNTTLEIIIVFLIIILIIVTMTYGGLNV